MTGRGTNTYLVGTTELVAIDPGPDDTEHLEAVQRRAEGRLKYVLVTHHHADHAPGARRLATWTGATLLAAGFAGFSPDERLGDGDNVRIPGWSIDAIHTPGHASDHLCFLAERDHQGGATPGRVLFSGDHVMGGSTVVIAPPDGQMSAYIGSLERLLALEPAIESIAPGHGELIDDPQALLAGYLAHRRDRERSVVRALETGSATPAELVGIIYGSIDPILGRAAAATIWAHLRALAEGGRARSTTPDVPDGVWSLGSG